MNNLQQKRFFKRNLQCKNYNAVHKFKHCSKIICNRCHKNGHIGRYCKNDTYLANLNLKYGCSQDNLFNQRKRQRGIKFNTHCCQCNYTFPLFEMKTEGLKQKCLNCLQSEDNEFILKDLQQPFEKEEEFSLKNLQ